MANNTKGDEELKNPKEKLTRTVAVRMSDAEYNQLNEAACNAALSLGAFIRFTLFGIKNISTEGLLNENE